MGIWVFEKVVYKNKIAIRQVLIAVHAGVALPRWLLRCSFAAVKQNQPKLIVYETSISFRTAVGAAIW
jgi:hypothetical protein